MFRWYKEAAVCYAYLEDADIRAAGIEASDLSHTYIEANGTRMLKSQAKIIEYFKRTKMKWFSRGWTLQELIAPWAVIFYDENWRTFGTRESLGSVLSHIRGISDDVLRKRIDLEDISIAQRMSWAATRTTTRTEDMAYSLLGIFNINMPLLYGEGEKAFVRLQEEIMKDSNDQSLFAWTPLRAIYSPAPACNDDGFTPRVPPSTSAEWRSTFAWHPREFVHSRIEAPLVRSTSFALTNSGVKINVPILPYRSRDSWASASLQTLQRTIRREVSVVVVLECFFPSNKASLANRVGVVYDCLGDSDLQLVRHGSAPLYPATYEDCQRARRVDVYLTKRTRRTGSSYSSFPIPSSLETSTWK